MIKENLNKIDYELKNIFASVSVLEKIDRTRFYFEITLLGNRVNESIGNCELTIEIDKFALNVNEKSNINWSYYTSPLKEHKIERSSIITGIVKDIADILSSERLDADYLERLKK